MWSAGSKDLMTLAWECKSGPKVELLLRAAPPRAKVIRAWKLVPENVTSLSHVRPRAGYLRRVQSCQSPYLGHQEESGDKRRVLLD